MINYADDNDNNDPLHPRAPNSTKHVIFACRRPQSRHCLFTWSPLASTQRFSFSEARKRLSSVGRFGARNLEVESHIRIWSLGTGSLHKPIGTIKDYLRPLGAIRSQV